MDNCAVCGRRLRGEHDGLCTECILSETAEGLASELQDTDWREHDPR